MSGYRNAALQMGAKARFDILQAYGINARYGHDSARRYLFEVAEAIAQQEDREKAASILYEIADLTVGKLPLPESMFPPGATPAPTAGADVKLNSVSITAQDEAKPAAANLPLRKALPRALWRAFWQTVFGEWMLGFIAGVLVGRSS